MTLSTEVKISTNKTVGDEDRFAIRRFIETFTDAVNSEHISIIQKMLHESIIVSGFMDIAIVKQEFVSILGSYKHKKKFIRFPTGNVWFSGYMFHFDGVYEEYLNGVLATKGNVSIYLMKTSDILQMVKIEFLPQMRLLEE